MSFENVLVLLISFILCSYFLVKYLALIVINAKVKGMKNGASLIFSTLKEEPLFLIIYLFFFIALNIIGNLLIHFFRTN